MQEEASEPSDVLEDNSDVVEADAALDKYEAGARVGHTRLPYLEVQDTCNWALTLLLYL